VTRERARRVSGGFLVGVVIGASGLKGEVKVKTFTEDPASIGGYGPLAADDGRSFSVKTVKAPKGDVVTLKLKGVDTRTAAEELKGTKFFVAREKLPKLAKNEFYLADLVDMNVEDEDGKTIGAVRGVHNFGAGDVIEIALSGTDTTFLPVNGEHVMKVDLEGKRIIVRDIEFWQDKKS